MERGSIGFNIPEAEISLDENGKISSIKRAERNFAHQIIEEFMLAANEAVAETFTQQGKAALYRIHEKPDPEKVREFREFSKTLGLELPRDCRHPGLVRPCSRSGERKPEGIRGQQPVAANNATGTVFPGQCRPFRSGGNRLHPFHLTDTPLSGSPCSSGT